MRTGCQRNEPILVGINREISDPVSMLCDSLHAICCNISQASRDFGTSMLRSFSDMEVTTVCIGVFGESSTFDSVSTFTSISAKALSHGPNKKLGRGERGELD